MSKGKAASQAGHAFLGAYLEALDKTPDVCKEYHKDGIGTKVCLRGDLQSILIAKAQADLRGVPCFLVVDSGCSNFFDGQPTVTALGIGPQTRAAVKHITGKFSLLQ
jgi:peptidyl-tRNA hydrolase